MMGYTFDIHGWLNLTLHLYIDLNSDETIQQVGYPFLIFQYSLNDVEIRYIAHIMIYLRLRRIFGLAIGERHLLDSPTALY